LKFSRYHRERREPQINVRGDSQRSSRKEVKIKEGNNEDRALSTGYRAHGKFKKEESE